MRITLKRRIDDKPDGRYWILGGPGGAITWTLAKGGAHGALGIHSPRPQWRDQQPDNDCTVLEMPCYLECADYVGAKLGRAWEKARRDDEVIWAELAEWYLKRLAGGEPA